MLAEFPIILGNRQNAHISCIPPQETLYKDCGVSFSQRKNTLYAHNKITGKKTVVGTSGKTDSVQWTFATCVGNNIYLLQKNDANNSTHSLPTNSLIKYDIKNDTCVKIYNNMPIIYRYDFALDKIYMGGFDGLYEIDDTTGAVTQLHDMEIMQISYEATSLAANVLNTPYGVLSTLRNGNIALSDAKGNTQILLDLKIDFPKLYDADFWAPFTDYDLESYDGKTLKFSRLHIKLADGKNAHLIKPSFTYDISTKKLVCNSISVPKYPSGVLTADELQQPLTYSNGDAIPGNMSISEYLGMRLIKFNEQFE